AHAVGHGVQARLQHLQQVLAGDALAAIGFEVGAAELAFQQAVDTAHFLLFAQLLAEVGQALPALLAVLAGSVAAALDGALVGEALFALEEKLFPFAAALAALGIEVTGHKVLGFSRSRCDAAWADGSRCAAPGSRRKCW